jgi:hemerythrin
MESLLYIVWNEKNNIGVPIIDEQHRGIVIAINSLYYFINEKRVNKALQPTLTILKQYTKLHFMTEEKLMKDANYPDVEEHILIHKKLKEKTNKISIDSVLRTDSVTVLRFLREWWLSHINKEDRKYAPYVIKLGGKK